MFSKDTYAGRRKALKEKVVRGLLLFLGNDEVGMNYADNTYHFRQGFYVPLLFRPLLCGAERCD